MNNKINMPKLCVYTCNFGILFILTYDILSKIN